MNNNTWDPEKLLRTSGSYWTACTLHAAVKLDLFTTIGGEVLSAERIAEKVKGDIDGVTRLLDALSALDLLQKEPDGYSNTDISATFLSKDSPRYIGHMIMHHHHLMESWTQLDRAVVTGESVRDRSSTRDDETREDFLMGMYNSAMNIAPELSDRIDLTGRRSLLDLGGGPGTYAIHFCLKNPTLRATIYDLPTTRPFAERTVERFELSDRIEFQAGDIVNDPIEGEYDVAWLSHLLHSEGPEACQAIVKKAVAALQPGGIILIHEFILEDTMDAPLFPAVFSLNMLLGTSEGRSYSEKELRDMLGNAGVKEIRRFDFIGPTESGILMGTISSQ
jgi:SAM-dependent methyltransferase